MTYQPPSSPAQPPPLVLRLDRLDPEDWPLVGGKAANLARLMRARLPVPAGFCISVAAFHQFLDSCPRQAELRRLLDQPLAAEAESAGERSRGLSDCLESLPVPPAVQQAVERECRSFPATQGYAVRSSATGEDSAGHSFAGLFESILPVHGQAALGNAVRQVWLSLYSPRALAYLARGGLPPAKAAMAVVIQEMIPSDFAGVLFTHDPTTGDPRHLLIEYAAGLGQQVVSGHVRPHRLLLDRASLAAVTPIFDAAATRPPPAPLEPRALRRLARISRRVERLLSGPVDLEWATLGQALFLLQARPATTPTAMTPRRQRLLWSNGNSGEAAPEPLTPMTQSVLMPFLQGLIDNMMSHLGLRLQADDLLSFIAGRPYFNVNLGLALAEYIPYARLQDVGDLFGGAHEPLLRRGRLQLYRGDLPHLRFHPWPVIRGLTPVLIDVLRVVLGNRPLAIPPLPPFPLDPNPAVLRRASDEVLCSAIATALPGEEIGRHRALRWMGIGAFGLIVLFWLSKRWFGPEGSALAARLTTGLGALDPAEAGRDLWRLAEWAQQRPLVCRALIEETTFAPLETRLLATEEGPDFLRQWRAWLSRNGHHARGELELMNPRWAETPDALLTTLRHYLEILTRDQAPPITAARIEALNHQRTELERDCRNRLRSPLRRWVYRRVLAYARRGLVLKENVKSIFIQRLYHARLLLLELGRRLVEQGRFGEAADIFFLRQDELRRELLWGANAGWRELLARRRAEHEQHLKITPPPFVFGDDTAETGSAACGPPTLCSLLEGLPVSPGVATGRARVILKPDPSDRVLPGEILVAPSTDPAWSLYFLTAAGLAIDLGGVLSHGSILAREYGLPAVTNLGSATRTIRTGDLIQVDGNEGRVTIVERAMPD